MNELVPLAIGIFIGAALLPSRRRALRIAFPFACVAGGVTASAVNQELHGAWTALFLSFDMLQVFVAASASFALLWSWRRRQPAQA